ncbi:unnamed protein product [Allacma fusca]|uniref:Ensconsin-like n=1 Tax=Allacma fusca TaxID=39272 RepID=A0A8J2LJZ9_9HEXA|nr:unnamed protein product [Allacma fusca]
MTGGNYRGVNNMTDQVNDNSRPGSSQQQNPPFPTQKTPSKADQQRLEKITALREKQNSERLKKLEELKEHAAAAAKLREEQDTRRRRHFLELSKKDEERRKAAEERRRLLEEERQTALVAKFESKRMTSSMMSTGTNKSNSNERKYAFGSCTPRLIENYDGFLWKSQYNLNFASPSPGAGSSSDSTNNTTKQGRATSAQDLLSGNDEGSQNRLYFFCGRRKTDLTPTIPIKRDFNSSPRSTTTSGFSSTMSTRPPSSLSSTATPSIMTSSTHSAVNMRSRPSARKPRPVSVHVTGISSTNSTAATTPTTGEERRLAPRRILDENRRKADLDRLATPRMRTPTSEERDTNKKLESIVSSAATTTTGTPKQKPDYSTIRRSASKNKKIDEVIKKQQQQPDSNKTANNHSKSPSLEREKVESKSPVDKPEKATLEKPEKTEKDLVSEDESSEREVVPKSEDLTEKEPTALSGAPESGIVVELINTSNGAGVGDSKEEGSNKKNVEEQNNSTRDSEGSGSNQLINFEEETPNRIEVEVVKSNGISSSDLMTNSTQAVNSNEETKEEKEEQSEVISKPKITNEEQAKAALAEKRRLAREALEREAARLEELRREEEEKQRRVDEEQERLLEETRKAEEERLQKAIRERELREEEDKKRAEEEEAARIEKEAQDKETAKEVERLRLEMEERLKREEEERVERRRRVEAIMSRTRVANRKSGIQDQNQQENLKNVQKQDPEVSPSAEVIPTTMNNETFNNLQNSSLINNFTNNNTTNSSTLISFDDNNHPTFNYNNRGQPEPQLDGAFTTSATSTPVSNTVSPPESTTTAVNAIDGAAAFPAPESAAATIQDLLS